MNVAPWVQTASGRAVDLFHPEPEQIAFGDVAHALSRINRFAGHTRGPTPWSVASHSMLVADLVIGSFGATAPPAGLVLAALLHDAHEAYTGDIVSPVKHNLYLQGDTDKPIKHMERALQSAIHVRAGLPVDLPEEWSATIRGADLQALAIEKHQLMGPGLRPWGDLPPVPDYAPTRIVPEAVGGAEWRFGARVAKLIAEHTESRLSARRTI